ncbi:MAG: FtsK/SpoIIIE domain-containing protein [Sulfuritalea sp.]|nr:FtsK/SpoIIIE domain-containing protein [Sulfuritalea sp.]MDP1984961.1 FtsK/SpoIIIE domain-containing protein [Sulfuritalea sp.]
MPDIAISLQDESFLKDVQRDGLLDRSERAPKWSVLRLALARSLQITTPPDEALDELLDRGHRYDLEQVTGKGQSDDANDPRDFDDAYVALLSVYHNEDLYAIPDRYVHLLQRHIRRGLREFRTSWRKGHDFHAYLFQDLFGGLSDAPVAAADRRQDVVDALTEIGVDAEVQEVTDGPRLSRYYLHLTDVNQLDRLRRGLDKLALSLNLQQEGVFLAAGDEARVVCLDLPRPRETWHALPGHLLKDWSRDHAGAEALPVWPGVDAAGKPFCFDLATAPHLLVGGTTGSGKSICIHALLLSLLWRQPANGIRLLLIDPKEVEFAPYRGLPHLVGSKVFSSAKESASGLRDLVKEMDARHHRFQEIGVANLAEAQAKGESLPRIVVVIEELADLVTQTGDVEEPLVRLAQKSRSAGIHLVLATQRPDAETFSGLLRSNIPARIALAVQKSSESKIILDEVGAEKLLGLGDMLVKPASGAEPVRVHGLLVRRDDIAACVRVCKGER